MAEFAKCPMLAGDIDELLSIERLCFPTPWRREDFEHEVNNPAAYYVVLKTGGRIAAYGGMWLLPFAGHITNIAVHPEFRRQGLGKMLVRELLQRAQELSMRLVYLEVREHNAIAQSLYRQFGFRFAGVEQGYYPDSGEDAYIMVCENVLQVPKITLRRLENSDSAEYAILCENVSVGKVCLQTEGTVCRIADFSIDCTGEQDYGFPALEKIADYARQVLRAETLCAFVPKENRDLRELLTDFGFEAKENDRMEMRL